MRRSAANAACLLAVLATASCTSSGMAPPAEVGGSQAVQTTTIALAPQPAAAAPASANTSAPAATASLAPAPSETATVAGAATLDAQAQALKQATPAFAGTQPSAGVQPAAAMPQGDGGPVAAVATNSLIQFAPITGATQQAAAPLSQQLALRARERGIGLAGNGGQPTHILKGYFSEMSEGGATTVIYVWDVLDPTGTRLHRIQGQEKVSGSGGWSAVPAKAMQAIANRTIDELAQWFSTRAG